MMNNDGCAKWPEMNDKLMQRVGDPRLMQISLDELNGRIAGVSQQIAQNTALTEGAQDMVLKTGAAERKAPASRLFSLPAALKTGLYPPVRGPCGGVWAPENIGAKAALGRTAPQGESTGRNGLLQKADGMPRSPRLPAYRYRQTGRRPTGPGGLNPTGNRAGWPSPGSTRRQARSPPAPVDPHRLTISRPRFPPHPAKTAPPPAGLYPRQLPPRESGTYASKGERFRSLCKDRRRYHLAPAVKNLPEESRQHQTNGRHPHNKQRRCPMVPYP